MQDIDPSLISLDEIHLPVAAQKNISIAVLRLDKIHPLISGNKWFKLRFYIDDAKAQGKRSIISFGGAWSNHLLATAAACRIAGFDSTGIIRGEEPSELSYTLIRAKELGMQLFFITRDEYREKKIPEALPGGNHYIIPEGGYGQLGADGAASIATFYDPSDFTHVCCAAGTGTMTAGLIKASAPTSEVISVSVLKNNLQLGDDIARLLPAGKPSPLITHEYHFGGYAKHTPALLSFMNDLHRQVNIPTDFVYTGKLFFGILDLVQKDHFAPGSRLLLIHSGGLQGNGSLEKGTLIF